MARTYGTCVKIERTQLKLRLSGPPSTLAEAIATTTDSEPDEADSPNQKSRVRGASFVVSERGHNRSVSISAALQDASKHHHHHHQDDEEVQLLTLRDFDPRVRVRIGGLVTARSVKYLGTQRGWFQIEYLLALRSIDSRVAIVVYGQCVSLLIIFFCFKFLGNLASKLSDQEQRDSWWTELRDEIRSHAKILCCTHVIGYLEASTIHEDVAILSITGTACTVRGLPDLSLQHRLLNRHWSQIDQSEASEHRNGDNTREYRGKQDKTSRRSDRKLFRPSGASGRAKQNSNSSTQYADNVDGPGGEHFPPLSVAAPQPFQRDQHRRPRMIRARDAKPCSYCHVPYHHRLAPFTNMKLVRK